jgi:predicted nuclease with RNAse H fold
MKKYLVGFDPGGRGKFGWCVVEDKRELPVRVVCVGVADHAEGAVRAAHEVVQAKKGNVIGVGIDAPLFWVADGCRQVDNNLRQRIRERGAPNAAGTVQQVNSLRGACLVQGMLAGVLSRQRTSGVPISESHPKAALWLLGRNPAQIALPELPEVNLTECWHQPDEGPHLRDAALACLSAWAMVHEPPDWRNLYPQEQPPISPIAPPLAYWMPK